MREQASKAVRAVLRQPDKARDDELVKQCALLSGSKEETIIGRLRFYEGLDERSLRHYLPSGSPEHVAAQFISLLTDLPAGWLYDCATNRSGRLASTSG